MLKAVCVIAFVQLYPTMIGSLYLRQEHEYTQKYQCEPSFRIWYNKDLISYSNDFDPAIDSAEHRLLTGRHTEKSEEQALQTYFLDTPFPFSHLFLGGITEQETETDMLAVPKRWKRILVQVASWMIEHKYLESDPRVFAKIAELPQDRFFQRVLYRHFPIPIVKDFHPIVEEQCRKGLLPCLKLVHKYAYAHAQQFNRYLNSDHDYFMKQYKKMTLPKAFKNSRNVKMLAYNALGLAKRDFCEVQGMPLEQFSVTRSTPENRYPVL
ncbi:hypothetical protein RvY_00521 [Ramazzottius varieornatus]|uniref:Uncharacterized protein n=1 Tax=Ramazzottius varieornatus TaxID=947166 RepID=A0A1D1UE03_RAMVA|nr:hypothetical protein RvY_00521 [Ramazzottius varieornatus]